MFAGDEGAVDRGIDGLRGDARLVGEGDSLCLGLSRTDAGPLCKIPFFSDS